jgi:hypothetical protein
MSACYVDLVALDALESAVLDAETVGTALYDIAGDNPPALLSVFTSHIRAIREASEAIQLSRGIGGVAPDGDKTFASPLIVRGVGDGLKGSDSRPD